MKALERVREIERKHCSETMFARGIGALSDAEYLLRAFRVMRAIAIDQTKREALLGYADEYRAETIDSAFTEAMQKEGGR